MNRRIQLLLLFVFTLSSALAQTTDNDAITLDNSNVYLPKELLGNWFEKGGREIWKLGLYDSVAIYNNCLWQYKNIAHYNNLWELTLTPTLSENNSSKIVTLQLNTEKMGELIYNESLQKPIACIAHPANKGTHTVPSKDAFPTPFFKQGNAIIQGYINGFTPKNARFSRFIPSPPFHLNSLSNAEVTTQLNNCFSIEIPLAHPQIIELNISIYNAMKYGNKTYLKKYFYVEPGSTTTCYLQANTTEASYPYQLFMGEAAEISATENMFAAAKIPSRVMNILSAIPKIDYKIYETTLKQLWHQDDSLALELHSLGLISAKALKVAYISNQAEYLNRLLEYNQNIWQPKIIEGNSKDSILESYKLTKRGESNEFSNKELAPMAQFLHDTIALVSSRYLSLLNEMNSLKEFKGYVVRLDNLIGLMKLKGIELNANAKALADFYENKIDFDKLNDVEKNIFRRIHDDFEEDYSKLSEEAQIELKDKTSEGGIFYWLNLPSFAHDELRASKIVSRKDKVMAPQNIYTEPTNEVYRKTIDAYRDVVNNFIIRRYEQMRVSSENKGNSGKGMIYNDRKYGGALSEEYLKKMTIDTTTINPKHVDSKDGITPQATTGELFYKLLEAYRGKVLLIEFWNTSDAIPSLFQNNEIVALKAHFKKSNVAFLNIAHENSPLSEWNEMKKYFQGIHYRLIGDEYEEMNVHFGLDDKPFRMLVDKKGHIVRTKTGQLPTNTNELEKLIDFYLQLND